MFTIQCIIGSSVGAPAPFRARKAGRAASLKKALAQPAGLFWGAASAPRAPLSPRPPPGPGQPHPALSGRHWCAAARSPFGEAWCCGPCKARRRAGVRARTRATGAQRTWGPAGARGFTGGRRPRGPRGYVRGVCAPPMRRSKASSSVRLRGPAGGLGQKHVATWEHRAHLLAPIGAAEGTMSHFPQRWQVCRRWEAGDQGPRRRLQGSSHRWRRGSRSSSRPARTQRR